jgi:hypothetical protein
LTLLCFAKAKTRLHKIDNQSSRKKKKKSISISTTSFCTTFFYFFSLHTFPLKFFHQKCLLLLSLPTKTSGKR